MTHSTDAHQYVGRRFFRRVFVSLLPLVWGCAALGFSSVSFAQGFIEGKHYTLIDPPIPTDVPKGLVEVREFFWYGCPHCFALEPHLEKWDMPKGVRLINTPAMLGERWVPHAHTYYALAEMNLLDEMHELFFKALHVKKMKLNDLDSIADFFAEHGVPRDKFKNVYKSFSVKTRVNKAERLAMQYQVRGVPLLTVNGRYVINSSALGSYRQMIALMDYLVRKELSHVAPNKASPPSD